MAQLAVSDEILHGLQRMASGRGQSVDELANELLRTALARPSEGQSPRKLFEAIAAMTPPGPQTDAVELLREVRDR